jgi:hypothetical protein
MTRPLDPRERPGTHCTGGWVGHRAGLDVCEKSRPHRDFFFFNASFVPVLYFVVLVLDLGPLGRGDHLSVLSLV